MAKLRPISDAPYAFQSGSEETIRRKLVRSGDPPYRVAQVAPSSR